MTTLQDTTDRLEALVERRRLERTPLGRRALGHADLAAHHARLLARAEAEVGSARAALRRLEVLAGPRRLRAPEALREIADAARAVRAAEARAEEHRLAAGRELREARRLHPAAPDQVAALVLDDASAALVASAAAALATPSPATDELHALAELAIAAGLVPPPAP